MFFASDGIDVVISQVQLGYQSSFSPTISSVPLLPAAEWRELSEASHKDMHRDVLEFSLIIKDMYVLSSKCESSSNNQPHIHWVQSV